jgi:hypothetical protein
MAIKLLPRFWQQNLPDQMLMLPVALVFTVHPTGFKDVMEKYLHGKLLKRKKP